MSEIRMIRDLFLWCMSVIYLFAFTSLYVQLPGLYFDNGILPARLSLQKEVQSFHDLFFNQPSLLRLVARIGIGVEAGLDLLALGGIILAFVAMVCRSQRNMVVFAVLWVFYLSLFQVGQTFMWFQWDILLLETGFLTILIAPFRLWKVVKGGYHAHDSITLWLVKWLLFRLMFASGVVKLTSLCPTWWGLTALNYHYETQCIPTPAAWYFHQLPEWFQKFSVVSTYVIEIFLPFLFFSPVRSQRLVAFCGQMLLQVLIIITGNYNFFNLLTISLCIPLVDDNFIRACLGKPPSDDSGNLNNLKLPDQFLRLLRLALNLVVYGALVYVCVAWFTLRPQIQPGLHVSTNIAFSAESFTWALKKVVPVTMWLGAASLAWEILKSLAKSVVKPKGSLLKLKNLVGCVVLGIVACGMFAISLVDHTVIDENSYRSLWPALHSWHDVTGRVSLTSSYGLFRTMTGVGGRPEVIIEGSNDLERGWREYGFLFKPGNVSERLTFVAPHQPRLDWQMWFAALGTYQRNPWFLNLAYRILSGQEEVLQLMGYNPFPERPPKYLRATLYHYHYTSVDKASERYSQTDWWVRSKVGEYLPVITKEEPSFINYLQQAGILQAKKKYPDPPLNFLSQTLMMIRRLIGQPDGFYSTCALFVTGLILAFLDPSVKLGESAKS